MGVSIQNIQDLLDHEIIIDNRPICFIDVIREPALFSEWKEKLIQICEQEGNVNDTSDNGLLSQLNTYLEMINDKSQMLEDKPYEFSKYYQTSQKEGNFEYSHSCERLYKLFLPHLNEDYRQYIKNHYNLTDTQIENVNSRYEELLAEIAKAIISAEKLNIINLFYSPSIKLKKEVVHLLHEQEEKEKILKLINDIESNTISYHNFRESIQKREHLFQEAMHLILHSRSFHAQLPLIYANIAKSQIEFEYWHNLRANVASIIGLSLKGILTLATLALFIFCSCIIFYPIILPLMLLDGSAALIAMTLHIILLSLSAIFWTMFAINSQTINSQANTARDYFDEYISILWVNFVDGMMERLFAVKLNALSITEYLEQNETNSLEDNFTETPNAIASENNASQQNAPTAAPAFFEKKLAKKSIEDIDTDSDDIPNVLQNSPF